MSLVWNRANKAEKTHSIYSDGVCIIGDFTIDNDDNVKFASSTDGLFSILIGCTGEVQWCDYIKKYGLFKLKTSNVLYNIGGNTHICRDIEEIFEEVGKSYKEKYNDFPIGSVILSINGYLFKLQYYSKTESCDCIKTNKDFICVGEPTELAMALYNYDNNIDNQDMLNAIAKVKIKYEISRFKRHCNGLLLDSRG